MPTFQNPDKGKSYMYQFGTSPETRTALSQKVRILTPVYGDNAKKLNQMGVVSAFNPQMSRNAEAVRGIGFGDKNQEIVPGVMEPVTASFERTMLYLSNLWQSTGYAAGVDGPVRSLAHHRWPFDVEQQLVFSSLADTAFNAPNQGYNNGAGGTPGSFDGGVRVVTYPTSTTDDAGNGSGGGHTAIITVFEACWFTSWSAQLSKDQAMIMESGDIMVTDVHDFASTYGAFLASGNDPTIGQLGSIRYSEYDGKIKNQIAGSSLNVTA